MSFPILEARLDVENFQYYEYVPTKWIGYIFVILFGISTGIHVYQACYYRLWFLFPTVILAGFMETIGWFGRVWSAYSPDKYAPFQMQISNLVLAPTPFVAAIFIITGHIITILGPEYSRLGPRLYSIVFLVGDIFSLGIQGAGGGIAAAGTHPTLGSNIMLGGIIFQAGILALYTLFSSEFVFRYIKDRPIKKVSPSTRTNMTHQIRFMIQAIVFVMACLFIRAVYRVVELADGWGGKVMSIEWLFCVFDGMLITFAVWTLNLAHPGRLVRNNRPKPEEEEKYPLDTRTQNYERV